MKLEKKTLLSLLGISLGTVLFAWVLNHWSSFSANISGVLSLFFPLILGFCMAFVLNIPMRFFERHLFPKTTKKPLQKLRRPLCIVISLAFILLLITAVVRLVVPELINAFTVLATAVPRFLEDVRVWAVDNFNTYPEINTWLAGLQVDWASLGKSALTYVTNGASSLLSGTVVFITGTIGGVTNAVIGFIFALYILLGKEHLKQQVSALCRAAFPQKLCENVFFVVNLTKRTFASFVTGQCVEACILGTLCWLGMLLFRFPYAPTIGALIGITALIPIVGAFIGMCVGAFMIMMISPIQALWFVIFLLCLQQIEGNLIYPYVVGSSVGLPGIWVLAAVTVGGGLWGIFGMLFAVPVCSVLYALSRLAVRTTLNRKGLLGGDADTTAPPPEPPAAPKVKKRTSRKKPEAKD